MRQLIPKKATADKLCGELVRSRGFCQIKKYYPTISCKGNLQWMHIFSRSYYQIRWTLNNAFCGCAAHHMYFTNHPIQWENCVLDIIGENNYQLLRKMALEYKKIDYGEIMYELKHAKKTGFIQNNFILS